MKQFCKIHFAILLILTLLLNGCVKNAAESAAETSMNQINVIEHQIKKQCPEAEIDDEIAALRSSVRTQLEVCEAQKATLREKNNTLIVILLGILIVFVIAKWQKIKRLIK